MQKNYRVSVIQQDEDQAWAETHGHHLLLNIRKGSSEVGFNAAETLMAALGTCLLTNVNAFAKKMGLRIDKARVEVSAVRLDNPPTLTEISYCLFLKSSEPNDKLSRLHELCVKWGTVTNTLMNGLKLHGELIINK